MVIIIRAMMVKINVNHNYFQKKEISESG